MSERFDNFLRETYQPYARAMFDHSLRVVWAMFGVPSDPNPMPRLSLFWKRRRSA